MSTNYYHETECSTCGHVERIHIGKSSAGWTFGFHGTNTIRSFKDWLVKFESGGRIVDEYDRVLSVEDFKALVEAKKTWKDAPAINLAQMLTQPRATWNKAETEYDLKYHVEFSSRENWLDDDGHSFSGYEFS